MPFDLDQRISEADEDNIYWIHRKPLARWQVALEEDEELRHLNLYLGVFDRSEITKVCDRVINHFPNASEDDEFEQTDLVGRTCFAQFTIDPAGVLVLDPVIWHGPVSFVSTLPWAIGRLEQAGLASLTSGAFQNAKQRLAEWLLNLRQSNPLTHAHIMKLYELLQEWSCSNSRTPPFLRCGRPGTLGQSGTFRFTGKPLADD